MGSPTTTCGPTTQTSSIIQSDYTIRPFEHSGSTYCIYKRYLGYAKDHTLWTWPCKPTHGSQKYNWEYLPETKQIRSVGSIKSNPSAPFCWYIKKLGRTWTQR